MPDDLDKKAADAPKAPKVGGGSIFDDIGSSIDSLVSAVKAIPSVAKDAAYYTYYGAKAALGTAIGVTMAGAAGATGISALALPGGMIAGRYANDVMNGTKKTFRERFKEYANIGLVGGILGGYLGYTFKWAGELGTTVSNSYGKAAGLATKAAVGLSNIPPFVWLHEMLDRAFIKEHKPKPVMEKMKKQKWGLFGIAPVVGANYSITPDYLKLPVAGAIALLYGMMTGEKKKEEKKETQPQYQLPPGYVPQMA